MQSVMKSVGGKGSKGVRGRARMLRQLQGWTRRSSACPGHERINAFDARQQRYRTTAKEKFWSRSA